MCDNIDSPEKDYSSLLVLAVTRLVTPNTEQIPNGIGEYIMQELIIVTFSKSVQTGLENCAKMGDIAIVNAIMESIVLKKDITVRCLRDSIRAVAKLTVSQACLSAGLTAGKERKSTHKSVLGAIATKRAEENLKQNERDANARNKCYAQKAQKQHVSALEERIMQSVLSGNADTALYAGEELRELKLAPLKAQFSKSYDALQDAVRAHNLIVAELVKLGEDYLPMMLTMTSN